MALSGWFCRLVCQKQARFIALLLRLGLGEFGPYKPRTSRTGQCMNPPVYEPCIGHTGRTGLNIQHALGVSCMDYCCPFSPLQSTGTAISLYCVRRLSSSTADECLIRQPMETVHAFH